METKKKAIAGIIIATIALAGFAVAVSAEGEGGVGPMGILPGSITAEHLASNAVVTAKIQDDAVTSDKILDYTIATNNMAPNSINGTMIINGTIHNGDLFDTGVINSSQIIDYTVGALDMATEAVNASVLAINAIPSAMYYTDSALSTTNSSFNSSDLLNASGQYWNSTIVLTRTANLSVAWTAQDAWVTAVGGGNLSVNCTLYNTTYGGDPGTLLTYPRDVTIADDKYNNLTMSIIFYSPQLVADTYTISMQIRSTVEGDGVGINKQAIVATAYPA